MGQLRAYNSMRAGLPTLEARKTLYPPPLDMASSRLPTCWTLPLRGALFALAVLGLYTSLAWSFPWPLPRPRGPTVEQATPDCGQPAALQAPAWQRAQHLARLGVDRWHQAGFRGQGIKVAILDSGFRGYRAFLGQGLPAKVTARSFRRDGNLEARDSQHGILCAEIVHALAPDAELVLANWEAEEPHSFLEAVRWAKSQGARLLTCSVIMPSWSDGAGGGPVNAVLGKVVGTGKAAGDVLCFASAGNTAQRHWCGVFSPDAKGWHQWSPGRTSNTLVPWGQERVAVELYGPAAVVSHLQVWDATTNKLMGQAPMRGHKVWPFLPAPLRGEADGACAAVVRFFPQPLHTYQVRLSGERKPSRQEPFHLVALGGSLDWATACGSIPFPADGECVQAVGAVDSAGQRIGYSSCGGQARRPKPDFVAEVPFPSFCRCRPFTGTSAAAPQATGLAAVWWSRHPHWTPDQLRSAMQQAARDLGPAGHDSETGFGQVRLP